MDFVGNLGTAHDHEEWSLGIAQLAVEVFELALHQQAHRALFDEVGHTFRGSVGTVRSAKGVVDVNVGAARQLLGEIGVVRFFGGVEAGVFQNQHFAGLQRGTQSSHFDADAIGSKFHGLAEDFAEARGHRSEREFRLRPALWTTQVGAKDQFGAAGNQLANRRHCALDAGFVGDDAVLERDVKIHAHEDFFGGNIEIAN